VARWEGKTRGGVIGYTIFVFLISVFHLRIVYFILNFVVLYFIFFSPKAFRSIYGYFSKRKKFGRLKSFISVWRNYNYLGQSIIDKIAILSGQNQSFTFDMDGEEYLHDMAKNGVGGFLIGAHAGNWDVAGSMLNRIDSKINVVMLDAEHRRIKEYLSGVMKNLSVNVIPIRDDFSHLLKIKEALQNKELICIHGDRFVDGMNTIRKMFLGSEADFPAGPFLLPLKFNVPVTFVFSMKEGFNHYHFYASKPVQPVSCKSPAERSIQTGLLLDEYVKELEIILSKYPEQWFNYYEFWS